MEKNVRRSQHARFRVLVGGGELDALANTVGYVGTVTVELTGDQLTKYAEEVHKRNAGGVVFTD